MELNDKGKVHLLKNLCKKQALTILKSCTGKSFRAYREALLRRFRGPGAKWRRLNRIGRISQRGRANVDQYYSYFISEIEKTELVIKDSDNADYKIPVQMNIHRFIEGLKSDDIKDKLYTESFATLEEYYIRAVKLKQGNPNQRIGSKRTANQGPPFKRRRQETPTNRCQIRCFECNQVGHKSNNCPSKRSNMNNMQSRKCFNYNKEGHIAKDCRQKDRKKPLT